MGEGLQEVMEEISVMAEVVGPHSVKVYTQESPVKKKTTRGYPPMVRGHDPVLLIII